MDINTLDRVAVGGSSPLHKATVTTKLPLTLIFITLVIFTNNPYKLLAIIAIILALFVLSKIPLGILAHIIMYPFFFSSIFAMATFTRSPEGALTIILKGVSAAMALTLLITTTPYLDIFSLLGLFLPDILVDILFFTYRSFFILLKKVNNFVTIVKLRGGYSNLNILHNLKGIAGALGVIIIDSFTMAERVYQVFQLRGYNGKIYLDYPILELKKYDMLPIGVGIASLVIMVII